MSQKQYWQSFGEVTDPENFKARNQDEFPEELPFEGFDDKGLLDAKAPRRDFLKYLGFSTAAATIAASCKIPVKKAIPYANKPENMIPGVPKYYATTYVQDGDVIPVVAKVRDGRPIKIEGNTLSAYTGGGTSARSQASVLDLYDMYRLKFPQHKTNGKLQEYAKFEDADNEIGNAIKAAGGSVVLLTSTIVSPSTKDIISKYPNLRHVQYDAVSYSGMLLANEASGYGRKLPTFDFGAAKVIVSLGADFLGTWMNPVENSRGYSKGRKIDEKNPVMSKHYQFEGHLSMTGANADERFTHRPSETGKVAVALLDALNGTAPSFGDAALKAGITKAANDLKANNGAALVVCGSNDPNVQTIVNAINAAIGANGSTVKWDITSNYRAGIDSEMAQLITDMEAGSVGTLMIYGANPVYSHPDGQYNAEGVWQSRFAKAMAKVKVTVSFNPKMDETTELCNYLIPVPHYLESWGDAEPKSGTVSFIQPTIYPLFKTRPFETSLLRWSGSNQDYETYFREYWMGKLGSEEAFNKALQDGIAQVAGTTSTTGAGSGSGSFTGGGVDAAKTAINNTKSGGTEIILYEKVSIGNGAHSGNPWLQELPDPISKASWDNYALISLKMAEKLNIKVDRDYEYYPHKPVVKFKLGNKGEITLPILVIPGMNADTVAIAVGYGRNKALGVTADGIGKHTYGAAVYNGATIDNYITGVSQEKTGDKYKIAQMQIHNSYENRKEVLRETTLASFKKDPDVIPEYKAELKDAYYKNANGNFREATLYGQHDQPGLKWGMNIDMNACYGCGACVVACHAENNVPVVGKREVLRFHDMHWLRIDRYFVTDKENPDQLKGVVFQPMLCQHCDNAPCENVCPVAATNHSMEGINQMAYNRCIGTRYCANNCPFKVRRFNWADYTGADSFPDNRDQQLVGKLDPVIEQMNDDLTRMVLNPDVTVRSKGVMEKCSFCVQKVQAAKLEAKKQDRPLMDGEMQTACQMACSADAIVFGNVHDKNSMINKVRAENKQRNFEVLEQLHVLPNITYLAKVRNTEEIDEKWAGHHEEHEATHGTKEEGVTPSGTPADAEQHH